MLSRFYTPKLLIYKEFLALTTGTSELIQSKYVSRVSFDNVLQIITGWSAVQYLVYHMHILDIDSQTKFHQLQNSFRRSGSRCCEVAAEF